MANLTEKKNGTVDSGFLPEPIPVGLQQQAPLALPSFVDPITDFATRVISPQVQKEFTEIKKKEFDDAINKPKEQLNTYKFDFSGKKPNYVKPEIAGIIDKQNEQEQAQRDYEKSLSPARHITKKYLDIDSENNVITKGDLNEARRERTQFYYDRTHPTKIEEAILTTEHWQPKTPADQSIFDHIQDKIPDTFWKLEPLKIIGGLLGKQLDLLGIDRPSILKDPGNLGLVRNKVIDEHTEWLKDIDMYDKIDYYNKRGIKLNVGPETGTMKSPKGYMEEFWNMLPKSILYGMQQPVLKPLNMALYGKQANAEDEIEQPLNHLANYLNPEKWKALPAEHFFKQDLLQYGIKNGLFTDKESMNTAIENSKGSFELALGLGKSIGEMITEMGLYFRAGSGIYNKLTAPSEFSQLLKVQGLGEKILANPKNLDNMIKGMPRLWETAKLVANPLNFGKTVLTKEGTQLSSLYDRIGHFGNNVGSAISGITAANIMELDPHKTDDEYLGSIENIAVLSGLHSAGSLYIGNLFRSVLPMFRGFQRIMADAPLVNRFMNDAYSMSNAFSSFAAMPGSSYLNQFLREGNFSVESSQFISDIITAGTFLALGGGSPSVSKEPFKVAKDVRETIKLRNVSPKQETGTKTISIGAEDFTVPTYREMNTPEWVSKETGKSTDDITRNDLRDILYKKDFLNKEFKEGEFNLRKDYKDVIDRWVNESPDGKVGFEDLGVNKNGELQIGRYNPDGTVSFNNYLHDNPDISKEINNPKFIANWILHEGVSHDMIDKSYGVDPDYTAEVDNVWNTLDNKIKSDPKLQKEIENNDNLQTALFNSGLWEDNKLSDIDKKHEFIAMVTENRYPELKSFMDRIKTDNAEQVSTLDNFATAVNRIFGKPDPNSTFSKIWNLNKAMIFNRPEVNPEFQTQLLGMSLESLKYSNNWDEYNNKLDNFMYRYNDYLVRQYPKDFSLYTKEQHRNEVLKQIEQETISRRGIPVGDWTGIYNEGNIGTKNKPGISPQDAIEMLGDWTYMSSEQMKGESSDKTLPILKMRVPGVIDEIRLPDKQKGKGIGSMIVNLMEDYSRLRGIPQMIVQAEPQSIPFWEKLGYKGEQQQGEETTLMIKDLGTGLLGMTINNFRDKYGFLSNFSPYRDNEHFEYEGIKYPSNEHFYQAMKFDNPETRQKIANYEFKGLKSFVRTLGPIRSDWDIVKDDIMQTGLNYKFSLPRYKNLLLSTENNELIENNTWGDRYWGKVNGIGQNKLGNMLMGIRNSINTGLLGMTIPELDAINPTQLTPERKQDILGSFDDYKRRANDEGLDLLVQTPLSSMLSEFAYKTNTKNITDDSDALHFLDFIENKKKELSNLRNLNEDELTLINEVFKKKAGDWNDFHEDAKNIANTWNSDFINENINKLHNLLDYPSMDKLKKDFENLNFDEKFTKVRNTLIKDNEKNSNILTDEEVNWRAMRTSLAIENSQYMQPLHLNIETDADGNINLRSINEINTNESADGNLIQHYGGKQQALLTWGKSVEKSISEDKYLSPMTKKFLTNQFVNPKITQIASISNTNAKGKTINDHKLNYQQTYDKNLHNGLTKEGYWKIPKFKGGVAIQNDGLKYLANHPKEAIQVTEEIFEHNFWKTMGSDAIWDYKVDAEGNSIAKRLMKYQDVIDLPKFYDMFIKEKEMDYKDLLKPKWLNSKKTTDWISSPEVQKELGNIAVKMVDYFTIFENGKERMLDLPVNHELKEKDDHIQLLNNSILDYMNWALDGSGSNRFYKKLDDVEFDPGKFAEKYLNLLTNNSTTKLTDLKQLSAYIPEAFEDNGKYNINELKKYGLDIETIDGKEQAGKWYFTVPHEWADLFPEIAGVFTKAGSDGVEIVLKNKSHELDSRITGSNAEHDNVNKSFSHKEGEIRKSMTYKQTFDEFNDKETTPALEFIKRLQDKATVMSMETSWKNHASYTPKEVKVSEFNAIVGLDGAGIPIYAYKEGSPKERFFKKKSIRTEGELDLFDKIESDIINKIFVKGEVPRYLLKFVPITGDNASVWLGSSHAYTKNIETGGGSPSMQFMPSLIKNSDFWNQNQEKAEQAYNAFKNIEDTNRAIYTSKVKDLLTTYNMYNGIGRTDWILNDTESRSAGRVINDFKSNLEHISDKDIKNAGFVTSLSREQAVSVLDDMLTKDTEGNIKLDGSKENLAILVTMFPDFITTGAPYNLPGQNTQLLYKFIDTLDDMIKMHSTGAQLTLVPMMEGMSAVDRMLNLELDLKKSELKKIDDFSEDDINSILDNYKVELLDKRRQLETFIDPVTKLFKDGSPIHFISEYEFTKLRKNSIEEGIETFGSLSKDFVSRVPSDSPASMAATIVGGVIPGAGQIAINKLTSANNFGTDFDKDMLGIRVASKHMLPADRDKLHDFWLDRGLNEGTWSKSSELLDEMQTVITPTGNKFTDEFGLEYVPRANKPQDYNHYQSVLEADTGIGNAVGLRGLIANFFTNVTSKFANLQPGNYFITDINGKEVTFRLPDYYNEKYGNNMFHALLSKFMNASVDPQKYRTYMPEEAMIDFLIDNIDGKKYSEYSGKEKKDFREDITAYMRKIAGWPIKQTDQINSLAIGDRVKRTLKGTEDTDQEGYLHNVANDIDNITLQKSKSAYINKTDIDPYIFKIRNEKKNHFLLTKDYDYRKYITKSFEIDGIKYANEQGLLDFPTVERVLGYNGSIMKMKRLAGNLMNSTVYKGIHPDYFQVVPYRDSEGKPLNLFNRVKDIRPFNELTPELSTFMGTIYHDFLNKYDYKHGNGGIYYNPQNKQSFDKFFYDYDTKSGTPYLIRKGTDGSSNAIDIRRIFDKDGNKTVTWIPDELLNEGRIEKWVNPNKAYSDRQLNELMSNAVINVVETLLPEGTPRDKGLLFTALGFSEPIGSESVKKDFTAGRGLNGSLLSPSRVPADNYVESIKDYIGWNSKDTRELITDEPLFSNARTFSLLKDRGYEVQLPINPKVDVNNYQYGKTDDVNNILIDNIKKTSKLVNIEHNQLGMTLGKLSRHPQIKELTRETLFISKVNDDLRKRYPNLFTKGKDTSLSEVLSKDYEKVYEEYFKPLIDDSLNKLITKNNPIDKEDLKKAILDSMAPGFMEKVTNYYQHRYGGQMGIEFAKSYMLTNLVDLFDSIVKKPRYQKEFAANFTQIAITKSVIFDEVYDRSTDKYDNFAPDYIIGKSVQMHNGEPVTIDGKEMTAHFTPADLVDPATLLQPMLNVFPKHFITKIKPMQVMQEMVDRINSINYHIKDQKPFGKTVDVGLNEKVKGEGKRKKGYIAMENNTLKNIEAIQNIPELMNVVNNLQFNVNSNGHIPINEDVGIKGSEMFVNYKDGPTIAGMLRGMLKGVKIGEQDIQPEHIQTLRDYISLATYQLQNANMLNHLVKFIGSQINKFDNVPNKNALVKVHNELKDYQKGLLDISPKSLTKNTRKLVDINSDVLKKFYDLTKIENPDSPAGLTHKYYSHQLSMAGGEDFYGYPVKGKYSDIKSYVPKELNKKWVTNEKGEGSYIPDEPLLFNIAKSGFRDELTRTGDWNLALERAKMEIQNRIHDSRNNLSFTEANEKADKMANDVFENVKLEVEESSAYYNILKDAGMPGYGKKWIELNPTERRELNVLAKTVIQAKEADIFNRESFNSNQRYYQSEDGPKNIPGTDVRAEQLFNNFTIEDYLSALDKSLLNDPESISYSYNHFADNIRDKANKAMMSMENLFINEYMNDPDANLHAQSLVLHALSKVNNYPDIFNVKFNNRNIQQKVKDLTLNTDFKTDKTIVPGSSVMLTYRTSPTEVEQVTGNVLGWFNAKEDNNKLGNPVFAITNSTGKRESVMYFEGTDIVDMLVGYPYKKLDKRVKNDILKTYNESADGMLNYLADNVRMKEYDKNRMLFKRTNPETNDYEGPEFVKEKVKYLDVGDNKEYKKFIGKVDRIYTDENEAIKKHYDKFSVNTAKMISEMLYMGGTYPIKMLAGASVAAGALVVGAPYVALGASAYAGYSGIKWGAKLVKTFIIRNVLNTGAMGQTIQTINIPGIRDNPLKATAGYIAQGYKDFKRVFQGSLEKSDIPNFMEYGAYGPLAAESGSAYNQMQDLFGPMKDDLKTFNPIKKMEDYKMYKEAKPLLDALAVEYDIKLKELEQLRGIAAEDAVKGMVPLLEHLTWSVYTDLKERGLLKGNKFNADDVDWIKLKNKLQMSSEYKFVPTIKGFTDNNLKQNLVSLSDLSQKFLTANGSLQKAEVWSTNKAGDKATQYIKDFQDQHKVAIKTLGYKPGNDMSMFYLSELEKSIVHKNIGNYNKTIFQSHGIGRMLTLFSQFQRESFLNQSSYNFKRNAVYKSLMEATNKDTKFSEAMNHLGIPIGDWFLAEPQFTAQAVMGGIMKTINGVPKATFNLLGMGLLASTINNFVYNFNSNMDDETVNMFGSSHAFFSGLFTIASMASEIVSLGFGNINDMSTNAYKSLTRAIITTPETIGRDWGMGMYEGTLFSLPFKLILGIVGLNTIWNEHELGKGKKRESNEVLTDQLANTVNSLVMPWLTPYNVILDAGYEALQSGLRKDDTEQRKKKKESAGSGWK